MAVCNRPGVKADVICGPLHVHNIVPSGCMLALDPTSQIRAAPAPMTFQVHYHLMRCVMVRCRGRCRQWHATRPTTLFHQGVCWRGPPQAKSGLL